MKKSILIVLMAAAAFTSQAQLPAAVANHLQYMLDSLCKKNNIKGASAAVLVPGMGTWKGAAGLSHGNVKLATDMWLPIGSNTKTFTAALMLKLQEEGKLNLDDTIGKWIQGVKNVSGKITIRQMLNHTSGLFNYTDANAFSDSMNASYTRVWQPEEMYQFIDTPDFAPGSSWEYSNTNFLLAGIIIKKIQGEPFEVTVRNKILNPQSLSKSIVFPQETPGGIIPHGWSDHGNGSYLEDMQATYNWDNTSFLSMATSAGAIVSTAEDNVKFWDALMTGKIINSASLAQMTKTVPVSGTASYGLGIMRYTDVNGAGRVVYCHGGTCFGYINENLRDSLNGICITVLSNQDSVYNNLLFNRVIVPMHKYLLNLPAAGIATTTAYADVQVFPNPATDKVQVQLSGIGTAAMYQVYDMTGRLQVSAAITNGVNTIDISLLPAGMYNTRVVAGERVVSYGKLAVTR